ncbi:hypothetical protein [Actinopolyspora halophila]
MCHRRCVVACGIRLVARAGRNRLLRPRKEAPVPQLGPARLC